jgi:hypothetical protein
MLSSGFVYYFICLIGDPGDFSPETKAIIVRQGYIFLRLTKVYFQVYLISLIFWIKGMVKWRYALILLSFIHFIGAIILSNILSNSWNENFIKTMSYISFFFNNILLIVLFWDQCKEAIHSK